MFQAKQSVLDRIEQSFWIFMKAPFQLVLPLALFNIIMLQILPAIAIYIFPMQNAQMQNISLLISMGVTLAIIYAIIYLTVMIPVSVSIIKSTIDIIKNKKVDYQENIKYSFHRLWKLFRVYWFIFEYSYLVPALCFIASGFVMITGMFIQNDMLIHIALAGMWISGFYAIIQGLYRWLKTTFSIINAMYQNDFEKESFKNTLKITDNNWWRILWNLMLVWLIWGLIVGLMSGILNSLSFINSDITDMISSENTEFNTQEILWNLQSFNAMSFIIKSIEQILSALLSSFIIVFSVVFYLRLRDESWNTPVTITQETKNSIEL